jgi:hypothetical protein
MHLGMLQVLADIYPEYADEEHLLIHITAGGAAGALASAVTTPLDVIKTRLQCQVSPRFKILTILVLSFQLEVVNMSFQQS